jgi:hypothetical protein
VAQHEKGINVVILVLAGDLCSYYSRDVLWAGTLVSGVYNLEELVCVAVWVRGKEPKSRRGVEFARSTAVLLHFLKALAKVIPVNARQSTIAIEVIVYLVGMIEIPSSSVVIRCRNVSSSTALVLSLLTASNP